MQTHDISIPFGTKQYRVLVLTQSSTLDANKAFTLSRVQHFEDLTGGTDSAILFQHSEPFRDAAKNSMLAQEMLQSFQNLQYLLLSNDISIPLLYISSPTALCRALQCLTAAEHNSAEPNLPIAATSVLPYCTVEPPMSQEAFTVLSDMFPCMRSVASMQREESLWRMVGKGMCETDAEACLEFWKEEYLAE